MTAPAPAPPRSFRQIPPAIYIALAANLGGALVSSIAMLLASGDPGERFLAVGRWHLLDTGCDAAAAILLALGLAELARRLAGPARALTLAGAYLGLVSLAWLVARPALAALHLGPEADLRVYEWLGRGTSLLALAGAALLTLGARAWRRAPLAAALLVALSVTAYGVPVVGEALWKLIGSATVPRQLYGLARVALHAAAVVWIAAGLAADGREPAPDPRAARAGFGLARGVLLFRIVAGCVISLALVGGRSPGAAKLVAIGGPGVMVVTLVVFALALQRVAAARVPGLPAAHLSLGAALTLWWGTLQLQQVSLLVESLRRDYLGDHALEAAQWFSTTGPIAAALGLALVGSAIAALARSRGDTALRDAATSRTVTFLVVTLGSIGLQTQLARATTPSGALALLLLAALLAIVALGSLIGLLARGAEAMESEPELPPARLV